MKPFTANGFAAMPPPPKPLLEKVAKAADDAKAKLEAAGATVTVT